MIHSRFTPMLIKVRLGAPLRVESESVSAIMLQPPARIAGNLGKGVLVLNQVDQILQLHPALKSLFLLIERKGWHGPNTSMRADIKLVEDSSTMETTKRFSPHNILLELSGGDFVDEQALRPLGHDPDFEVIQIACWSQRKRLELMVDAAAQLPEIRFVHFGHFEHDGTPEELAYRQAIIERAQREAPNIHFPYVDAERPSDPPQDKTAINTWINRARIGLLTTHLEGHPRFKMECLSADRPMLIPSDTTPPTRKHITPQTGLIFDPSADSLSAAITTMLGRLDSFSPREYLLTHSGQTNTLRQVREALRSLAAPGIPATHYDSVDWDGRNQNLHWGLEAMNHLTEVKERYRPLLPFCHPHRWVK